MYIILIDFWGLADRVPHGDRLPRSLDHLEPVVALGALFLARAHHAAAQQGPATHQVVCLIHHANLKQNDPNLKNYVKTKQFKDVDFFLGTIFRRFLLMLQTFF